MNTVGYICVVGICAFTLIGCVASPRFTSAKSQTSGEGDVMTVEEGIASYYADEFNGRVTSNGEKYDMNQLTAAHRTLPFNSRVRVINTDNGQSVIVRINDRGPFVRGRIIDLTPVGARAIGMDGLASVIIEVQQ